MEDATKQGISVEKSSTTLDRRISVAPMMDWTDRHCRYFLRGYSPRVRLYTEMITSAALVRGNALRLLEFDPAEHPVALQLGGSEPKELATAAKLGEDAGYDEINLNCGCPSDRVAAGSFGACLMKEPSLVAECIAAMVATVKIPVTVKLRIGVVEEKGKVAVSAAVAGYTEEEYLHLRHFAQSVIDAGSASLIVHARKAVLGGLSPKDNREVPPLRFDVAARLRSDVPGVPVILNGGLRRAQEAMRELERFDGVMLGREAYHRPGILAELHELAWPEDSWIVPSRLELAERMARYAAREQQGGTRLSAIARHALGLYAHEPGAREFRRRLSEGARAADARPELFILAAESAERARTAPGEAA